jgi:geranylgeranyl diphosphate synthase, type I
MLERVEWVFAFLDELIGTLPVPASHKEHLQAYVGVAGENARASPELSVVQLPILVHAAVAGDERPALPVAAACTLLYLGVDLQDSVLDHELPPYWRTRGLAEANLAATALAGALPQLSIARLQRGTSQAKRWALVRLFADTLLTIMAGQHEDLLITNLENVSLENSQALVERKSGSASAMLARAGIILATEDPRTIETYTAFGLCYGMAKQLINDVWGIWGENTSQDLLNGKRTFPVIYALSTLHEEQRDQLHRLLAIARESAEYHDEVRALLTEAGSVRYTALIVWLYQQRARNYLDVCSPQGSAGRELRLLLDRVSLLPWSNVQ